MSNQLAWITNEVSSLLKAVLNDPKKATSPAWSAEATAAWEKAVDIMRSTDDPTTIPDFIEAIHENNVAHGWFDADRSMGDDIALLHSEVTEAFEEYREHGVMAYVKVPGNSGPGADLDVLTVYNQNYDDEKPLGFPSELADIFIRLCDTAKRHGVDLEREVLAKMKYNATRPYRHGNKAV